MFIKLLLCVGDHNKGRYYNREQGISCSVPMGSIHSDQGSLEHRGTLLGWHIHKEGGMWIGFWSIRRSFPGKIWKYVCGCEVEEVIQEVEIARAKAWKCVPRIMRIPPSLLLSCPSSFLPSLLFSLLPSLLFLNGWYFHIVQKFKGKKMCIVNIFLPLHPYLHPFISHPTPPTPAYHHFLLSPKHPSRVALCKCKQI